MRFRALFVAGLLTASAVWAWQYEDHYVADQLVLEVGGEQNYGTGSKSDFGISCPMCHLPTDGGFPLSDGGQGRITVTRTFTPPLGVTADGGLSYAPNTRYAVRFQLLGEHRGLTSTTNRNQMAATFENTAGDPVGVIFSDTGFSKVGTCPDLISNRLATFALYDAGVTTVTFNGCNVVVGVNRTPAGMPSPSLGNAQWRFDWQAPDAGTVLMYWGVIDASGEYKSLLDDVVNTTEVLRAQ